MKSLKVLSKIDFTNYQSKVCQFPGINFQKKSKQELNDQLLIRSVKKNQKKQNNRLKTTKQHSLKPGLYHGLMGSRLTLTVIGTSHAYQQEKKIIKLQKKQKSKNKIQSLKKSNTNYFSLKMNYFPIEQCSEMQFSKQNQFLLKCSNKIRLLYNSPRNKNIIIVISIDFILNQYSFWKDQSIFDSCSKTWRMLQNFGNIVWIIKKQKSLKKLIQYTQRSSIHLDMVYLLQKEKNPCVVTVDFNILKTDLNLSNQKLIIINSIKCEEQQEIDSYRFFEDKVPLINYKYTTLHFLRIENMTLKTFSKILYMVSSEPPPRIDINFIWDQYFKKLNEWNEGISLTKNSNYSYFREQRKIIKQHETEQQILEKLETLKKEWISWVLQMKQINNSSKLIQGQSIQFIVGDLLRRNYDTFLTFTKSKRKNKRKYILSNKDQNIEQLKSKIYPQMLYTIPIYMWKL